jgi:hypothetical protein
MVQSTSLATAARYEEDTPATSGDKGALVLAVRNDAGGTLVDANGDYAPLQVNNLGELIIGGPGGVFTVVVVQPTHDLLNCNANIQVGDADVAPGNPVPTEEQETPPTDASKNNPSFVFTYTAGDLTGIAMTIGATTYNRTLAYTNGDLTSMTVWS